VCSIKSTNSKYRSSDTNPVLTHGCDARKPEIRFVGLLQVSEAIEVGT
jgi:hypothetical protein